jgi:AmiR/NasT family two-component response regulator
LTLFARKKPKFESSKFSPEPPIFKSKLIREIEGFDKVSIVALTGFSNASFDKAIEAGFDDVFVKPLHYENLEPLLTRYLSLNVVEKAQLEKGCRK